MRAGRPGFLADPVTLLGLAIIGLWQRQPSPRTIRTRSSWSVSSRRRMPPTLSAPTISAETS
jgi:hypothetical protein